MKQPLMLGAEDGDCSQLATIQQAGHFLRLRAPKGEKQARPIGRLGPEKMAEVYRALQ